MRISRKLYDAYLEAEEHYLTPNKRIKKVKKSVSELNCNVVGVGIGYKKIQGFSFSEAVIQILVKKKRNLNEIPKKLHIPGNFAGVVTCAFGKKGKI